MKTYIGTTSTGHVIQRKTNKVYTHAVVCLRPDGTLIDAKPEYCGRYELAVRRLAEWAKVLQGRPGYTTEIVPVKER